MPHAQVFEVLLIFCLYRELKVYAITNLVFRAPRDPRLLWRAMSPLPVPLFYLLCLPAFDQPDGGLYYETVRIACQDLLFR